MPIRNIIFDLGGVLIDVDYQRTEQAFINAGIRNFGDLYSQQSASPLFEQLETGKISNEDFYTGLRQASGVALQDDQINTCWNTILGKYYPEAIAMLRTLRKQYRVFLFSNTNAIHHARFTAVYREQFGQDDFDALFEKAYYSHQAGVRKPYPSAYEWVLKDAGLDAAETLFIDDTLANIEGARQAGLQTLHLKPPMKVWEVLGERLTS